MGFEHGEALTLGRAVAGLNAYAKGVRLGIYEPTPEAVKKQRRTMAQGERISVDLLNGAVPVLRTLDGIRAVAKDKPVDPASVERYLRSAFGELLDEATGAMTALAASLLSEQLAPKAYVLYEQFRPKIPAGQAGSSAKGVLDLGLLKKLASM